jgi:hypothetical protein
VITGWRGEGTSKRHIKEDISEDIENFTKKKQRNKDCFNVNKIIVEMKEWSGKEKVMKQKGKLRERKETEKIFINNDLTKQGREIQNKLRTIAKEEKMEGKEVKVGYGKICNNEGIQWRWNEERGRLEIFQ